MSGWMEDGRRNLFEFELRLVIAGTVCIASILLSMIRCCSSSLISDPYQHLVRSREFD